MVVPAVGLRGSYDIALKAGYESEIESVRKRISVMESTSYSIPRISGSWCGIYHWCEVEGRLWNDDVRRMGDEDWKLLVRGMHELEMDIIVIQETFSNSGHYVNKHEIKSKGYFGKAFYDSNLFPGRVDIESQNPIEAILSEADRLDMHIFLGVGLYAWFDFSKDSLEWHKKVAEELWNMFGHHRSVYGWYLSGEIFGNLGETKGNRDEIVCFLKEFKAFINRITPDKPVMLACNCFDMANSFDHWKFFFSMKKVLCTQGPSRRS